MIVRTAELDDLVRLSSVTARLSNVSSPLGGIFGNVRSSGHKAHRGWDLYAAIGTVCFAVADGEVSSERYDKSGYGRYVTIKLFGAEIDRLAAQFGATQLFALYGHLSPGTIARRSCILAGTPVARTGNSGNASNTPPHLHFELRLGKKVGTKNKTVIEPGERIDPGLLLGYKALSSRSSDRAVLSSMFKIR